MSETSSQSHQSPPSQNPSDWDQFTRQAAIVILLLGVLFLIILLRPLINLLAITGIFILILSYPMSMLRAKTRLSYSAVVLVVFIPLAILLILVFRNIAGWVMENIRALAAVLEEQFELNYGSIVDMENALGLSPAISDLIRTVLEFFGRQFLMVIRFISFTSISLFLAFLFILEMPANLARSFKSLSSASQREFGIMFDKLSAVWNGWLRSTVITSIIIGSSTAVELFLFGIPYAGILGVVTGFLNLVPTFGPLISYLLIIIVTYTQGSTYLALSPLTLTLLVLGINLVINQVARLVIFPKLAGKATRLPIFLVILGLVVAAILWGVLGVVLVVPLLGTASEVLKYVIKKINRQDPYPGEQLQSGFWEKVIYDK